MSSSQDVLKSFTIPLKDIKKSTRNFSPKSRIGGGEFGVVYKGQVFKRWQNRIVAFKRFDPNGYEGDHEFRDEVVMILNVNHDNIIPFIGYCKEAKQKIIVYEYAVNGSLDHHIQDPIKRRYLTWVQRLKICIGAARGLEYLHSGIGVGETIVHRNIKGANILLDDNLEAKICDFGLRLSPKTQLHSRNFTNYAGANFYMDPNYYESGVLKKESDIYSLGVVMFEILSGMLANEKRSIDDRSPKTLMNLVRQYYANGLEKVIDPCIKVQIGNHSLHMFKEVAYECISFRSKDRPTIGNIIKRMEEALDIQNHAATSTITITSHIYQNLQRFLIPLKEINLATSDFSQKNQIGVDGFGVVYKGQLSERWQNRTVAFKRLDPNGYKGEYEFPHEVKMMSSFNHENIIPFIGYCDEGFGVVYKGQLSERWQNRTVAFKRLDPNGYKGEYEFPHEVKMMSSFNHENIIPFIGYCDEGNEMIIASEYAVNGSLDQHLKDPNKIRSLTWSKRLTICIGVARGLKYLHLGLGEQTKVIHRAIKSANILLDDSMEPKIGCFVLSILVDQNQRQVYEPAAGTPFYLDPIYMESGIVMTESDVYSFGVVLFEMLSGMLAYNERSIGDDQPKTLINLVRSHYDDGPENLIDPHIRDEIDMHSFQVFNEIAYQCISLNLKDRPNMNKIIKRIGEALHIQNYGSTSSIITPSHQYQNLESSQIPLEEIKLATRDFSVETQIGDGGFGVVYKGQLSHHWQNCEVAIKRLDPNGHQGKKEFLTELRLNSSFHHKNIIRFVGYCDEGNEMIIVYDYASSHSLDHHLQDSNKRRSLTWSHRLNICLGVARGLNYLHSSLGEEIRVIHRDIKSGNILLDENLEAKICDFGLSKQVLGNQQGTHVYTKAAGTNFYLDPIYQESGILRKDSDVYSFGVVLFELLSGMLAYHRKSFGESDPQPLINLVRRYYHDGFERLIDPLIRDQIDSRCFCTLKELAYQCISYNSKERPTMEIVIERIEDAIDFQLDRNS